METATKSICLCGEGDQRCNARDNGNEHPICGWGEEGHNLENCQTYAVELVGCTYLCGNCASDWHRDNDPFVEGDVVEVASYVTNQEYGGAEEGGWWYGSGSRQDFLRIPYSDKAVADAKKWLTDTYGPEKPYSTSVLGGSGHEIKIKRKSSEGWPCRRPHYE